MATRRGLSSIPHQPSPQHHWAQVLSQRPWLYCQHAGLIGLCPKCLPWAWQALRCPYHLWLTPALNRHLLQCQHQRLNQRQRLGLVSSWQLVAARSSHLAGHLAPQGASALPLLVLHPLEKPPVRLHRSCQLDPASATAPVMHCWHQADRRGGHVAKAASRWTASAEAPNSEHSSADQHGHRWNGCHTRSGQDQSYLGHRKTAHPRWASPVVQHLELATAHHVRCCW
mmetsp:Transcript_67762/g.117940  ORF Transcript_67762/g.117940 Transcript_67762/m.117940 type:complete len:227 (+) Transcript_67762:34-714(+)